MTERGVTPPADVIHRAGSHQRTLDMLFEHPMSHNIEWRDIVTLLESLGTAVEGAHGALHATINKQSVVLHRPKHKDVPQEEIINIRHFLRRAGVEPRRPAKGPNSDPA
jgi:hypothetical protein